jgi:hypothetical protein
MIGGRNVSKAKEEEEEEEEDGKKKKKRGRGREGTKGNTEENDAHYTRTQTRSKIHHNY